MAEVCPHCGAALPAVRDAFCSACGNGLDEAPAVPQPRRAPVEARAAAAGGAGEVWYATEERVHRRSRYDDRGALTASAEGFVFVGEKGTLTLRSVGAVGFVGPVIPWVSVGGLLVGDALVLLLSWAGAFNFLTLDNPVTYILLALLDLLAAASWPLTWVRVDYHGEDGRPRSGYFTPASVADRWRGGAKRLYARVRQEAGPPSTEGMRPS